ncbi:phosphotransferase family protein [Cellulomonas endophytica]|uniref:phosphotransferase family protein n=1 Tax=Cellulomonas endophytica TaxID=2494735 RepID=UPI001F0BA10C|nr:phosphotransferase [Cellulomonas endophytica]
MSTGDAAVELPIAFSGQRLDWRDLPRPVRGRIEELAHAQVTVEIGATTGFSPGFASVLELSDGHAVFVKAVSPEQNPASVALARAEIRVSASLPLHVPAPRLLWSHDDGTWVVLGFEAVPGLAPELPWRPQDLRLVLDALVPLADAEPLPGHDLPRADDVLAEDFTGWRRLAARGGAAELDRAGDDARMPWPRDLADWCRTHLDRLVLWEQAALPVLAGDALVHGDLRADNIMIDESRTVWFIDWPHASVGAPWLDLAFMLPSVALQGGGAPHAIFRDHPVADGVGDDDLRAALAGLAGYFVWGARQPAPRGIPNLRPFQHAQGMATLEWLRGLT